VTTTTVDSRQRLLCSNSKMESSSNQTATDEQRLYRRDLMLELKRGSRISWRLSRRLMAFNLLSLQLNVPGCQQFVVRHNHHIRLLKHPSLSHFDVFRDLWCSADDHCLVVVPGACTTSLRSPSAACHSRWLYPSCAQPAPASVSVNRMTQTLFQPRARTTDPTASRLLTATTVRRGDLIPWGMLTLAARVAFCPCVL
jgi:hypothetical protein